MNLLAWLPMVLFFIAVPVVVVILAGEVDAKQRRKELEEAVDGRWNGRVRRGRFLLGQRIEIRVDDIPGEITFHTGDIPWSRVWFNWPSSRRLRITPEGFSHRVRRLFGATELHIDDPSFDPRFWIETSHDTWARGLLDAESRMDLLQVQRSLHGSRQNELMLDVGPSGLSLRVSWATINNRKDMGKFVELAISLLRKARGFTEKTGVVIEQVRTHAGSDCPVCGHPVTEAPHKCHSCRTPHHNECWSYFGGCSLYGCRAKAA